jgi:YggT family protein
MTEGLRVILGSVVQVILIAIFGRVIISWLLVAGMRNEFILRLDHTLSLVTDPIMRPLRRIIPAFGGMIDITPMVAIIILIIVQRAIASL